MKLALAVALCLLILPARPLAAQAPDSKLTFEVASVRPTGEVVPGTMLAPPGGPGTDDPGRISWPRTTLFTMMGEAYDVTGDQITGLNWLNTPGAPFYAVDATIPPGTTKEQFRLMLQNLLADRFHLKLLHETQIRPGYELSVAAGGPKLKEWTQAPGMRPGMALPVNFAEGTMQMIFKGSLADFCRLLATPINLALGARGSRPHVTDKTGLTGMYEFTMEYAYTGPRPPGTMPPADGAGMPVASDPAGGAASFFRAFEKLGLKLVKVKDVPVDVLIVDSADKVPTEN